MVLEPDRQLIKASAVPSQGLPRIRGCPPNLVLGCNTTKSAGYSQESTEMTKSSNTPSGWIVDQSASSRIVGVGRTACLRRSN